MHGYSKSKIKKKVQDKANQNLIISRETTCERKQYDFCPNNFCPGPKRPKSVRPGTQIPWDSSPIVHPYPASVGGEILEFSTFPVQMILSKNLSLNWL